MGAVDICRCCPALPKAQPPPVHGTPTVPAASLSAPPMGGGGGVEAGAAGIWGCLRRNVPAHKGPIVKASALTAGRQQTSPHSPNTSWCTQEAWEGMLGEPQESSSSLRQMSCEEMRDKVRANPRTASTGGAMWPLPGAGPIPAQAQAPGRPALVTLSPFQAADSVPKETVATQEPGSGAQATQRDGVRLPALNLQRPTPQVTVGHWCEARSVCDHWGPQDGRRA